METVYQGDIEQVATKMLILEYNPTYKNFNLTRREYAEENGFVRRESRIKIQPATIARDPGALAFADLMIKAAELIKTEAERRGA